MHDRFPWMRARSTANFIAKCSRIKCPLRSEDQRLAVAGQVPRHYFAQLEHQLEVAASELHYWSFDGERGALRVNDPNHQAPARSRDEFWRRVAEKPAEEPST